MVLSSSRSAITSIIRKADLQVPLAAKEAVNPSPASTETLGAHLAWCLALNQVGVKCGAMWQEAGRVEASRYGELTVRKT